MQSLSCNPVAINRIIADGEHNWMQNRHGICLVKYVSYFQNRQRFRTSTALEDHVLLDVKRHHVLDRVSICLDGDNVLHVASKSKASGFARQLLTKRRNNHRNNREVGIQIIPDADETASFLQLNNPSTVKQTMIKLF